MRAEDLVGTWRLVSLEARSADGSVSYLLGPDARGFIMYLPDGYMSVAMFRGARERFGTVDLLAGTESQLAEAARTYITYAGSYEVKEGRVYHHVEASLFPDWVGTTQERIYELEGSRLTLSTDPMILGGQETRAVIVWERVRVPCRD